MFREDGVLLEDEALRSDVLDSLRDDEAREDVAVRSESARALLAAAPVEVDVERGMRSVCPGRMVSESISFAARTASTVTS